jgi:ribonuclease T2
MSCRRREAAVSSIDLSAPIRDRLQVLMPGFASNLHLHEWTKHGTCYEDDRTEDTGADPDEYYGDAMGMLEQVNSSAVRALFEAHIGQVLTLEQVEQAFQEAFGNGAGERFLMVCGTHRDGGAPIITELWISLTGNIRPETDLGELILASPPRQVSSSNTPCPRGLVVRARD